jgi:Predicted membrane protein
MENSQENIFSKLRADLTTYLELRFEYLKLNTYERTSRVLGVLSYGLVLIFSAFFAFLFIFLALGFFLGDLFNSYGMGFGAVAAIYFLLIWLIVVNREMICNKVQNEIISALTANEEKNDTTNEEQSDSDSTGEVNS